METKSDQAGNFDYSLVEPLDWSQLRTLLWDGIDRFPDSIPDRWDAITEFVNRKCPDSVPLSKAQYKTVFERLIKDLPGSEKWISPDQTGCQLWTKILYQTAQDIFSPNPAFMNLGFVQLNKSIPELQLEPDDEIYRLAIQLYQHVLGKADLTGKTILEIGCGCGGGASYLMRSRPLTSVVGVDLLTRHIEICNQLHHLPGLYFCNADAQSLPFSDQVFDGVLNIESSHSYNSMENFLSETKRVLRPGGKFWFADLRPTNQEWGSDRNFTTLLHQLENSGMKLLSQTNITDNVLAAMDELAEAKKMMLDMNNVTGANRRHFEEIMLCQGSSNYAKLKNGDWEYRSFVLLK